MSSLSYFIKLLKLFKAMCICHELGNLFIRWRLDSKLNDLDKESKMSTQLFNSPTEAGNFIENRLFDGPAFAYTNKRQNRLYGKIDFIIRN